MKNYYVTVEHRVVISRKITVLVEKCTGEGEAATIALEKEELPLISKDEDIVLEEKKIRIVKVEKC